jgi:hypothetical protein
VFVVAAVAVAIAMTMIAMIAVALHVLVGHHVAVATN